MSFEIGQVIRNIDTPLQKYNVIKEQCFGIDGALQIESIVGPLFASGKKFLILPHTIGLHSHNFCKECKFELDV
jgi:hypothetical protein